ncbi:hypothetical protein BGW80DRAFT_376441 [Lactifluus volemus]|nr:hypothetical protein BGW80DRAFT_376441 [Lactifluus volemus]
MQGIEFMHRRNTAYRVCTVKNVVWTNPPSLVIPENGTPHHHRYSFLDFGFFSRVSNTGR